MLGAQARAAELQAMRSQAQRQKTHEIDEPPPVVPVSLTDFGRNALQSRNKGFKTYKPLNLADFIDQPAMDVSEGSTSTTSSGLEVTVPLASPKDRSINKNMSLLPPLRPPPSAPRAMLESAASPKSGVRKNDLPSLHPTPLSFQQYQVGPNISPQYAHTHAQCGYNNFLFGLDDYSPTKNEIKQAELQGRFSTASGQALPPLIIPPAVLSPPNGNMVFTQPARAEQALFYRPQDTSLDSLQHTFQPTLPFRSDTGRVDHIDPTAFSTYQRTSTFVNDLMLHEYKMQSANRPFTGLQFRGQQFVPAHQHDQPYDRKMKMQNFVAAQQAMAKTGKTVLHNPSSSKTPESVNVSKSTAQSSPLHTEQRLPNNLHSIYATPAAPRNIFNSVSHEQRKPASAKSCLTPAIPVPAAGAIGTKLSNRRSVKECPAIMRAIKKRDEPHFDSFSPRFEHHNTYRASPWQVNADQLSDVQFPVETDVYTMNWCDPSITTQSRDRTKRLFRSVAAQLTNRDTTSMTGTRTAVVGAKAGDWLRAATVQDEGHRMVEQSVKSSATSYSGSLKTM